MSAPRTLTDSDYPAIAALAARGCSYISIAKSLGMDQKTFLRIRKEDERAADAVAVGRAQEHDALVSVLYATAMDSKHPKATTAAIFLLKTRHDYFEGRSLEDQAQRVSITFNLPGALKPAQYLELIEVEKRALPNGGEEVAVSG